MYAVIKCCQLILNNEMYIILNTLPLFFLFTGIPMNMMQYKRIPFNQPASVMFAGPDQLLRRAFTCKICHNTLSSNQALKVHMRTHTKEKPFKCDVCDRCFTTNQSMRLHRLAIHKSQIGQ